MKKDVIRKISAVLFVLCAVSHVLSLIENLPELSHNDYGDTVANIFFIVMDFLFICGYAALGVSVWLNKRNVSIIGALALAVASLISLSFDFFIYLEIRVDDFIYAAFLPSLFVAISYLLLFFAVYAKKGAFVLSCGSATYRMFYNLGLWWYLIERQYLRYGLNLGDFVGDYGKAIIEDTISSLFLALPILLWGISQRKPRAPKLAEGASAGDTISALEKLNELRQAGELSEEEFSAQKAELMKRL